MFRSLSIFYAFCSFLKPTTEGHDIREIREYRFTTNIYIYDCI